MTFAQAADKYMAWVGFGRRSKQRDHRRFDLLMLGLFLRNPEVEDITLDDVMEWLNAMAGIGWHPNTVWRKVVHLRKFFRFLRSQGYAVVDAEMIPVPDREFSEPEVLSEEQYRKLLEAIPADKPNGVRDIAQISLLHDTGVRLGELLDLDVDDVDVHTKHVATNGVVLYRGVVRTEKVRSKPPFRQIYWLERTNQNLVNWLSVRAGLARTYGRRCDPRALFINTAYTGQGRRPSRHILHMAIRKYSAEAGLPERIHPHMFRHAFARSWVLGGADTSAIASLLGHANIESSAIYTRLFGKHLEDAYVRFMPDRETE